MGYLGARGTLIYEKNLMSKISCQTPFKETVAWDGFWLDPFSAASQLAVKVLH